MLCLFYYLIIRAIESLAGLHVESGWLTQLPVFRGGVLVVQVEQPDSNWTPHGLHMDSRQKIGWATTKDKLRILVRVSQEGGKEYSIREVGGHLYIEYNYHEASHVLACSLTKNKKKVLKIENKLKNKE